MELPESTKNEGISTGEAINFVWCTLLAIGVPTASCAWIGRFVDKRFGISPWGTLIGIIIAAGLVWLVMRRMIQKFKDLYTS